MTYRFLLNLLKPRTATSLLIRRAHNENSLVVFDNFSQIQEKSKKTYIEMVKLFANNDPRRRNHCEFIQAALKHMEEFNVHKDLDVYKALLDVLPKGKFVPTNIFQAEFMHYPKQQQTALDLLEQMEDFGVMGDSEMEAALINTFGRRGFPVRKFWRMMYWMPKFKNLSPWPLPEKLPQDAMELAKLAIERITSVDVNMKISVFKTGDIEDSIDHTWIVSAQCAIQKKLIEKEAKERKEEMLEYQKEMALKKNKEQKDEDENKMGDNESDENRTSKVNTKISRKPLKIVGAQTVYIKDQIVQYFILMGPEVDRRPVYKDKDDVSVLEIPTAFGTSLVPAIESDIHEQDDGTILAVCATGTSTQDSLLSWIRLLEKNGNPGLSDIPIVFTLSAAPSDLVVKVTNPSTSE